MSEKKFIEQRFAALIRKVIIAFLDVTLLISSNYLACYITMDGTVLHSPYSSIVMSAWHIVILAFICIVSNFAFGLYNSVWSFAGVDEIIRSFVSATAKILSELVAECLYIRICFVGFSLFFV